MSNATVIPAASPPFNAIDLDVISNVLSPDARSAHHVAGATDVQSEREQPMSAVDGDVLLAGHPIRHYRSLTCWTDFDWLSHGAHSIEACSVETASGIPAGRFENRPQALAHA